MSADPGFCAYCGAPAKPDETTCRKCGEPLAEPVGRRFQQCRLCGDAIPADDATGSDYCANCRLYRALIVERFGKPR